MVVINTGIAIFQVNASKLRRPLDTKKFRIRATEQEHLCCGFLVRAK